MRPLSVLKGAIPVSYCAQRELRRYDEKSAGQRALESQENGLFVNA